jgi:hypothetical protein
MQAIFSGPQILDTNIKIQNSRELRPLWRFKVEFYILKSKFYYLAHILRNYPRNTMNRIAGGMQIQMHCSIILYVAAIKESLYNFQCAIRYIFDLKHKLRLHFCTQL